MEKSIFLKLNSKDFLNGLVVAILSAVLIKLSDMIGLGFSNINWYELLQLAITAGIGYLIKNLATNSQGQFLQGEKKS